MLSPWRLSVPAIDIRRVKTEMELQPGQCFCHRRIARQPVTETLTKIPFIGDIPILGKFFQSVNHSKSNTELIVIVTPEIVQPASGGSIRDSELPGTFMAPNSKTPMHTPESGTAAAPAPATIPVEQLITEHEARSATTGGKCKPVEFHGSVRWRQQQQQQQQQFGHLWQHRSVIGSFAMAKQESSLLDSVAGFLRPKAQEPDELMRVVNQTRQTEIGARIAVANHGARRRKGLFGRRRP